MSAAPPGRPDPPAALRARRAARSALPEVVRDPAVLEAYLEDASGRPRGEALGLARVADEGEAAELLAATLHSGEHILCQAARTSLTGGAVPRRELVISVERMDAIGPVRRGTGAGTATVRVQPGVRLDVLQRHLASHGLYYPPVPTYDQAMIGGTVATNAGGAATFKYGVTRDWVRALRVVLFDGHVLEIERGQAQVRAGGSFRIRLDGGVELDVPAPGYRLPPLKKISAGYHAADPLDLLDLFVGSEGTLGLITSIEVALAALPPAVITGLAFCADFDAALALTAQLREAARRARDTGDPRGPDVRAVEYVDGAGLELLRQGGVDRRLRVRVPPAAGAALLFELELPEPATDEQVQSALLELVEGGKETEDGPLQRLFGILRRHGVVERLELAFPQDESRRRALREFREAVPRRVNELLAERKREHPSLRKLGGDLIVPFDRLREMVACYERGFHRHGLEFAIWGHLSDGNLHPNALPRDEGNLRAGARALLAFADEALRLGGCPLSEHGVGRDPIKQRMLRRFLGREAVLEMSRIKRALDPPGRFAPGVLFPAPPMPGRNRASDW